MTAGQQHCDNRRSAMLDFEIFTDKIGGSGKRVILKAYEEARAQQQNQIASEHLLLAISAASPTLFQSVMRSLNLDPQVVTQAIRNKVQQADYPGRGIRMSDSFRTTLIQALKCAHERGRRLIESPDIFIALFQERQGFAVALLEQFGVDQKIIVQKIRDQVSIKRVRELSEFEEGFFEE
jgi:ATP-dependent Clp protease ATP-binding subunit ClpA